VLFRNFHFLFLVEASTAIIKLRTAKSGKRKEQPSYAQLRATNSDAKKSSNEKNLPGFKNLGGMAY